jgi:hypothetical protein
MALKKPMMAVTSNKAATLNNPIANRVFGTKEEYELLAN